MIPLPPDRNRYLAAGCRTGENVPSGPRARSARPGARWSCSQFETTPPGTRFTADTPPLSDQRFDQRPLLDDPLDLVTPAGHPLTERPPVTLSDAANEPWIVSKPGSTYHQLVTTACMAAGFSPDIAHYADEWDTGTAFVAHGFGVSLVPRLARLHSHWPVTRIPLRGEPAPARRILAVTRMGAREHPTTARALGTITATASRVLPAAGT